MEVLKIKFENWNYKKLFKNWSSENYLKIEVFENYLRIEFGNWKFENYLKIEVLKIKFENQNFEKKLFENECGPCISDSMRFPLEWRARFLF